MFAYIVAMAADPMTLAVEATKLLTHFKLKKHVPRSVQDGSYTPTDLPTSGFEGVGPLAKLSHFIDIIVDFPGDIPKETVVKPCQDEEYDKLPSPLCLAAASPCKYAMQLYFVPKDDGRHCVVKHVRLNDKQTAGLVQTMCHGIAYRIVWGVHEKVGVKALTHMLNNLSGWQVRLWSFDAADKEEAKEFLDDQQVDAGFDFLEQEVPKIPKKQLLRYQTKWLNSPGSPIFKWNIGLVEKIIKQMKEGGVLACIQNYCPVTMVNINPIIRDDPVGTFMKTMDKKSFGLLGESGMGKTFLMRAVMLALSRRRLRLLGEDREPELKSAPELDFFRGEPGDIRCPFVFDDGELYEQKIRYGAYPCGRRDVLTHSVWVQFSASYKNRLVVVQLGSKTENAALGARFPWGPGFRSIACLGVHHRLCRRWVPTAFNRGCAPHYAEGLNRSN